MTRATAVCAECHQAPASVRLEPPDVAPIDVCPACHRFVRHAGHLLIVASLRDDPGVLRPFLLRVLGGCYDTPQQPSYDSRARAFAALAEAEDLLPVHEET